MNSPRIGIFIQARSNSSRLPGKIFESVSIDGQKSILEHIYSRLSELAGVSVLAVLIPEDDIRLRSFCEKRGINYFSGATDDVRERYRKAAIHFETDLIVRATGDNPCVDPGIAADTISGILSCQCDLFSYSNLPLGIAVEAFRREALLDDTIAPTKEHREHVSLHIKHHPDYFNVKHELHSLTKDKDPSLLPRLTVDTKEDLMVVRSLFGNLGEHFTVENILDLFNRDPSLFKANAHIKQLQFPPLSAIRK